MTALIQRLFTNKLVYLVEDPIKLTPEPRDLSELSLELLEWYQFLRQCFNELKQFIGYEIKNEKKYGQ